MPRGFTPKLAPLLFLAMASRVFAASDEPAALEPVWTVALQDSHAVVLHNQLAQRGLAFPLSAVRLHVPRLIFLSISPDGTILSDRPVKRFDPIRAARIRTGDYMNWDPSAEEGTGVLYAVAETIVLHQGDLVLSIPRRGSEAAIAADADIGAVCVFDARGGQESRDPRGNPGSLVVFNMDGDVLQEVPFEQNHSLGQLYVSDDGAWVTATDRGEGAGVDTERVLWVGVTSGNTRYLPGITGGFRYYSEDSRTMVTLTGGKGGGTDVSLFSLADPSHPELKTTRHTSLLGTATVNRDGSLFAAVGNARVFVFNRKLEVVATAERSPDSDYGVTMVGDFLLVGYQRDELPNFIRMGIPSKRIDVYDVGALAGH